MLQNCLPSVVSKVGISPLLKSISKEAGKCYTLNVGDFKFNGKFALIHGEGFLSAMFLETLRVLVWLKATCVLQELPEKEENIFSVQYLFE